jgi:hypothetical protein
MASEQGRVVVGLFASAEDARAAIQDLRNASFSERSIGLLTHGGDGDVEVTDFKELEGNRAPAGAAIGAAAGAGGGALWALGVAAGVLPAIGPVIAGGALVAVLASAAAGAGAGTIVGTLVGLGVSDEEAAYYDDVFRKGGTVVVVHDDARLDLAQTILGAHSAEVRHVITKTRLGEKIADELARS